MKLFTYGDLTDKLKLFEKDSRFSVSSLGKTCLLRNIPVIKFGYGKRRVLYVGTHHGMETISSALLISFCLAVKKGNFCDYNGHRVGSDSVENALKTCTYTVVPMLNPDGAVLATEGIIKAISSLPDEISDAPRNEYSVFSDPEDKISIEPRNLKSDFLSLLFDANGKSTDFGKWQANGRGVDLNHNYSSGFAEYKRKEILSGANIPNRTRFSGVCPESEPETRALCKLIRSEKYDLLLTFHSQGEVLYGSDLYLNGGCRRPLGEFICKTTGYKKETPEGLAAYGGLTDWFLDEMKRPAYTVELGLGENPIALSALPSIKEKWLLPLLFAPTFV